MADVKQQRRLRIKNSIRKKVRGIPDRPRLSVFRSNRAISAQVIDDTQGKTLAMSSSHELSQPKINIETSKNVGKKIAEKTLKLGITSVVFDRNAYLYHGNVKALAEGAREGGLKF